MEFRKADRNDVQALVENRMEFVNLVCEIDDPVVFKSRTKEFLDEHIDKDDLIIYIAVDEGKIVSNCWACLYQTIPLRSCPNGKAALLLNVYTNADHRREGLAEKTIRLLLEDLKSVGIKKVVLEYTDAGLPLYQKIGFVPFEHQLQIKL